MSNQFIECYKWSCFLIQFFEFLLDEPIQINFLLKFWIFSLGITHLFAEIFWLLGQDASKPRIISRSDPLNPPDKCPQNKCPPEQMSTRTNVYQEKCLPGQMSTRTNVYQDKCLPGQMCTRTNVYQVKCLLGQMSTRTNVYPDF